MNRTIYIKDKIKYFEIAELNYLFFTSIAGCTTLYYCLFIRKTKMQYECNVSSCLYILVSLSSRCCICFFHHWKIIISCPNSKSTSVSRYVLKAQKSPELNKLRLINDWKWRNTPAPNIIVLMLLPTENSATV